MRRWLLVLVVMMMMVMMATSVQGHVAGERRCTSIFGACGDLQSCGPVSFETPDCPAGTVCCEPWKYYADALRQSQDD